MGNMKRKKNNRNAKRRFFDNRDKGEKSLIVEVNAIMNNVTFVMQHLVILT